MSESRAGSILLLVVLGAVAGCSNRSQEPKDLRAEVVNPTAEFPLLRFADGQTSLNDRCPVRKVKLNPKMVPVYVNGRPVGFC